MRTDDQLDQMLHELAEAVAPPGSVADRVMQQLEVEPLPTQTPPSARLVPDVPTDEANGVARATRPNTRPPRRRHTPGRLIKMLQHKSVRWSLAAALAAGVVLAIGLWPDGMAGRPATGVAWAQVVENISVFRPYSCRYTWEYEGRAPHAYDEMRMSLSRRREVLADGTVRIFDLSTAPNVVLTLRPDGKQAERRILLDTEPRQDPDFLRMIAGMQGGLAEDLGTETVDGRPARKFHRPDKTNEFTVWADAQTGLPIRIEIIQPAASRRLILSEFRFDDALDESLFDTGTVPPGCEMRTVEVDGVNPTEEHLIEGLREIATFLGGEFPAALDSSPLQQALDARAASLRPSPDETQLERLRIQAQRIVRYLQILQHFSGARDITYSGQSIRLGDAATPILSWTPKGSSTRRVVYADLHVTSVPVETGHD